MKRIFDLFLSFLMIGFLLIPMLLIFVTVRLSSKGPALYWSDRIGRHNKVFKMPKFRSMLINTPTVATHLLKNPDSYLSPIGKFLRQSSLDELPQIFSIIKGDMSFVGPRPALYNQKDLIALRKKNKIDNLMPGITGWAQINGRDKLSITDKVLLDVEYLHRKCFFFDLKILWLTLFKAMKRDGISH